MQGRQQGSPAAFPAKIERLWNYLRGKQAECLSINKIDAYNRHEREEIIFLDLVADRKLEIPREQFMQRWAQ